MEVTVTNTIPDGIRRYQEYIKKKEIEALKAVGEELLHDIDNVEPKIPVDTGELRNSGSIEINELEKTVEIVYTAPHALKVHESVGNINWKREGSGPQFIYAKLANARLRQKYLNIMGNIMKFKE